MAWKMTSEGADDLARIFDKAAKNAPDIAAQGLYVGAGIVADAITEGIENIQTEPFRFATKGTRMPSPEEKAVIQGASGITCFNKNGSEISTHIGFKASGYGEINGRKVPIPLIAASIESGTSFMKKQPFMRKSVNRVKKQASDAIVKEADTRLQNLLEGK